MSACDPQRPAVVDGEVVSLTELTPGPLLYLPAVRPRCRCGRDGRPESHGFHTTTVNGRVVDVRPMDCDDVLAIRARVAATPRREVREAARRPWPIAFAVLAVVGGVAVVGWLLVVGVTSVISAVVAWLATYWPGLGFIALVLLLLGGGAKCAGIHCGGCRG